MPRCVLVLLSLYHASPRNVKIEPRACQSVTPAMLPSPDMHTRVRISKHVYMGMRERKICTTWTTSGCHRDANVHFHPVEPRLSRMSRHINALEINTFNRESIITTPEPSTNPFLRRTLLQRSPCEIKVRNFSNDQ